MKTHTVQEIYRATNKPGNQLQPTLRLTGKTLKQAGFTKGTQVKVSIIDGVLIIAKVANGIRL